MTHVCHKKKPLRQFEAGDATSTRPHPTQLAPCLRMSKYEAYDMKATRMILSGTLTIVGHLKDTLSDFASQEKGILSQIARLELRLKNIKEQHNKLKQHVNTTKASLEQQEAVAKGLRDALSPGRRLPNNVLTRIFHLAVQISEDHWKASLSRWNNAAIGHTPIILSSVCSHWRSLVRSDPLLWAPFLIQLAKFESAVPTSQTNRITHWTTYGQRSQQCLVLDNWKLNRHLSAEKYLASEALAWKSLSICVAAVPDNGAWDIQRLRAREVEIYRNDSLSLQFFEPLMRYASILTIFGPPPQWGTLPWAALKSLTIKNVASKRIFVQRLSFEQGEFLNLLRATPQLTDLILDFVAEGSMPSIADSTSFTHYSLESISVHQSHFVENGNIFGVELVAPSLRKLTFLSTRLLRMKTQGSFHRTWDAPTHLVLPSFQDYNVEAVSDLLLWYPGVDTLEVKGPSVDTLFIFMHSAYHHIPAPSELMPLPRLTNLVIRNSDLRGEALIELLENRLRHVQARTPDVSEITNITLYNSPKVTPAHWVKVEQLLREASNTVVG